MNFCKCFGPSHRYPHRLVRHLGSLSGLPVLVWLGSTVQASQAETPLAEAERSLPLGASATGTELAFPILLGLVLLMGLGILWLLWRLTRAGKRIHQLEARRHEETARKEHSDRALKAQLRLMETVLDAIPIPVFYKDSQGAYLGCNRAFCRFTGMEGDQVRGKKASELFPDHGSTCRQEDRDVQQRNRSFTEEATLLDAQGRRREIVLSKAPLIGPDGKAMGVAGAFLDITPQKEIQNLLAQTGSLARMGGWKVNLDNNEVSWTSGMYDIHEVDEDYVPSLKNLGAFYDPDAAERFRQALQRCQENSESIQFDEQLTTARGQRLWVRVQGEPADRQGRCAEIVGAMLDITELKEAQLRLLEERELFTAGPVMVFRWEAGESIPIEYASPSVRLLGYEPEDFTAGRLGLKQIVHPEDLELVELPGQAPSDSATPPGRSMEFRLIDSTGNVRWVIAYTYPHYDASGKLLYADGYMLDITQRRKTEDELQRARRLDALGVLAGGIAHDFNNILTAILGNINLAGFEGTDPEEARKILSEAETATLRAKELAQQLLTFSKGGTPVRKAERVGPCIRDTVNFCLRGSKVRAELDIDEDLWPCRIDANQISQVINNIVLNALQSMPSGGTLKVRAHNYSPDENYLPIPQGRYVKIALEDSGCGITQEHLDRIFDPYFSTKQSGSGLGLAVSYAIVQKHDGFLWAESSPGQGSRFHIALPAEAGVVVEPENTAPPSEKMDGQGRILIMDDDIMVARTVQRMLQHHGFQVELTHDGQEAVDTYRKAMEAGESFDAVILDLTVPGGMGGAKAIGHLLELDSDVRAIVSSGYSSDPVVAKYRQYGFRAVVPKPYDVQAIIRAIKDVLTDNEHTAA